MQHGNQLLTQLCFVTARVYFSFWMVSLDDILKSKQSKMMDDKLAAASVGSLWMLKP